ncbi:MAG TPA: hypothetical protein VFW83_03790 [Bryobacteraceae bacterium]|nr:hypothetical protein [Bryobacteraceae bacterium]
MALVVGAVVPASASLLTYSSAGDFASANTDQAFQNISFAQGDFGTSLTEGDVIFANPTDLTGALAPTGWPAGNILEAPAGPNTITITLPDTVRAIGFYAGPQNYSNFGVHISNSGGDQAGGDAYPGTPTSAMFFGFRSDSPITSLTVTAFNPTFDRIAIEDVSAGTPDVAETPEIATFLLVASGLFFLRFARRWMPTIN